MAYKILSNEQMAEADRKTIESGVPGYMLMETAAQTAVDVVLEKFNNTRTVILCGPGNNGGDGFVMARLLQEQGCEVELACLVSRDELKGDAAKAAFDWEGAIKTFKNIRIEQDNLVIDAVFGTGFSGDLKEPVIHVFKGIKNQENSVLAVDIPSGVNGNMGTVDLCTLKADVTVTFHRKKLGHMLYPGVKYCGEILVKDIGIMNDFEYTALENHPDLWADKIPHKKAQSHKYDYGHAVIYGAPELTGATRLAAESCARVGAGLVTVLAPEKVTAIYRETLAAYILVRDDLEWSDERITARLYGSGGLSAIPDFSSDIPTVLDADALNGLPGKLNDNFVLTPHEGEFARIFPDIKGSRLEKAQEAARQSGAYIVLKGPDTIIAAPDGQTVINTHASPVLATAGSGDVLAGMIAGFLAQGMRPMDAACAAVWIHGECALRFGEGLVAADIPSIIPDVLQDLS